MMDPKEMSNFIQSLTPVDVQKAYFGAPRKCMCGCSGTYSVNAVTGVDETYADNVNPAEVTRILRVIQAHEADVHVQDGYIVYADIGPASRKKAYCVYLDENRRVMDPQPVYANTESK